MKIAVVGPGALGCLLGGVLMFYARQEVWFLDHNPERTANIAKNGLILEEGGQIITGPARITVSAGQIGPVDLLLLCVKAHNVDQFLTGAGPLCGPQGLLIAFQNGILHIDLLKKWRTNIAVALGVTAHGATLLGPGHVRHAGIGATRVGFIREEAIPRHDALLRAAGLLSSVGIETEKVANIMDHVWWKLIVNAGINALTAIFDCPNGGLLDSPRAGAMLKVAVEEATLVAMAKGITMTSDPVAMTINVCRTTKDNLSSMLQDIRKGRRTEIEAINGAVIREGKALGIPTPINEELYKKVKALEASFPERASL